MGIEWRGLGPEILISLDRNADEPLRAQLERALREAVRTSRLQPGERLPSSRELAQELGLSRGLVVECYDQLQAEGYFTSQQGSGTRVADSAGPQALPEPPDAEPRVRFDIDFAPAVPDLSSFPRGDWAWATNEVCRTATNDELGYLEPRGNARLREVVARYSGRVRGTAARADLCIITTGFTQGLNLALMALAGRGIHRVGFEDPGYDETGRIAAELAGVTMVPIPIDDDGIVVSALHEADVGAVVLTPAHQWPTGVVMSAERRRGVAEWAVSTGGYVVEDDYDAEFRYDHEPIGALQGLAPSRVISISTASKALAPTVRLGWMLCPPDLVADIADLKGRTDRGSPGIDQLVLARLIESGRYDRHLRKMRREYARRRDALVEALAVHAPEVRVSGLAAGFHAIAHLPPGCTEAGAIAGAQAVSVGFHGLSANRSDRSVDPPALVLGFGDLDVEAIREGIAWAAPALRARP